jgi:hypothetical protein
MVAQVGCDGGGETVEPRPACREAKAEQGPDGPAASRCAPACRESVGEMLLFQGFLPRSLCSFCTSSSPTSSQRLQLEHTIPSRPRDARPAILGISNARSPRLFLPSLDLVAGTAADGAPVLLALHCKATFTCSQIPSSHPLQLHPSRGTAAETRRLRTCRQPDCRQIAVSGLSP